jgi:hypothetical protein
MMNFLFRGEREARKVLLTGNTLDDRLAAVQQYPQTLNT